MIRFCFIFNMLGVVTLSQLVSCGQGSANTPDSDADNNCPDDCPEGEVCRDGECVPDTDLCLGVTCEDGERCYLGVCVDNDPCVGVVCPNEGDVCQHGECVSGDADYDEDGVQARDDCDDRNENIYPGASELCNGLDDDCDDAIDETFDLDGDLFPGCEESPESIRDCNDDDPWIHPGADERCNREDDDCDGVYDEDNPEGGEECGIAIEPCQPGIWVCTNGELQCYGAIGPENETCNGADDDCNGTPDDGTATASCPALDHATVACVEGSCSIDACIGQWQDLNEDDSDGCETLLDDLPDDCESATNFGTIADVGSSFTISGTIAPAGDDDWVTFIAEDIDTGTSETFHVTVEFTANPDGGFGFDIRRGACGSSQECGSTSPHTTYEYYTDFFSDGDWGTEIRGEDNCHLTTQPGGNICTDNGSPYTIRIYRVDGTYSSEVYSLRVTNG